MKEEEIRPEEIFQKYLKLAKEDAFSYFHDCENEEIKCFSCNVKLDYVYTKYGFNYSKCNICSNILVNPRPKLKNFSKYYTDSPSTEFWATTFYKKTEQNRKEKLWIPKAQKVLNIVGNENNFNIIDIGSGYGSFLDVINSEKIISKLAIEPSVHLSKILRKKKYNILELMIEDVKTSDLPNGRNVFTCFELFEHLHNPYTFVNIVEELMNPNDIFIFTTLNGLGFDLFLLNEKSNSIHPPHHLNFFNPTSIKLLFKNSNATVKVLTPGELDVNILEKNIQDSILPEKLKNLVVNLNQNQKEELQDFISKNNLSSHMWTIVKKH